ncbi:MAG: hypothetical protein KY455_07245 [Euryarchaeota archaeon]|nr:hypothetical protein [Euryarchaeota archaeon]
MPLVQHTTETLRTTRTRLEPEAALEQAAFFGTSAPTGAPMDTRDIVESDDRLLLRQDEQA